MAKYAHPDVLDKGPNEVKASANVMALISGYSLGDSYATVNAAKLASVAVTTTDFTLSTNGTGRRLTGPAGKTANASAGATTPDLHVAFLDSTTSRVLLVLNESSDQTITNGNPVAFPTAIHNLPQPV